MNKLFLIILCVLLSSCSRQVRLESCTLVPPELGWKRIEKPEGIDKNGHWTNHRYFLWFKNDEGHVRLCERDASDQCYQSVTNYEYIDGEWVSEPGETIECLF